MSKHVERSERQSSDGSDGGFEAPWSTPEFRGPVEPLDGHEDLDHYALVYEDRAAQLATAVPFVRQGIERGERCLYIVDDNSRDELVAALRDGGVDVDAALDAGQLSVHTVEETYRKGGEFDLDEARTLLRSAMEGALDEYEGFRVTAEETWLVGDEPAQADFMACEAHVNDLVEGEDAMALCQYNRAELPPEVVEDVIETHPYLIYDGTACPNDYYAPPAEYFGPDRPARENERKLETLVDRTDARASLRNRERREREMYEITSDPDRSFEEKLDALFDLGCGWFGLDVGGLAKVDPDDDYFEVEYVSGDHEHLVPGAQADLSETYCRVFTDRDSDDSVADPVAVIDPVADGFEGEPCYEQFGVRAYLGSYLEFEEGPDRTFWFVSNTPRDEAFSDAERTFHHLMGQWVRYELERRQRERELRQREQHLSALVETTPECIKTVAADGTLLQMNPAGLDMVEADSESDVIGGCVYDLIAPEDRERFREFNEKICQGESGTLEFDIVGLDGTRRHMETHAAPLRSPDGETSHVALTRDVTERKERAAELRQTKNRFETVFEQSDDGIFVVDPGADEFVDANPAAAEMTGYPRDELLSLAPSELHPDEVEQFRAFLDEVQETGSAWSEDLHCRHRDGHDIPAEITASTITLDGRSLVLALVRDVSERKQHERYQRDLYEIIADRTASAAEKFERMLALGCERFDLSIGMLTRKREEAFEIERLYGTHLDLDEGMHTPPMTDNYCRRVVETGEPVSVADAGTAGWDGDALYHEFGLECYAGVQLTVGGDAYGTICFTDREPRSGEFTEAERTFLELMGQCVSYELERNHRERQLEDKNDRLENFASMLAHELRNPVTIGQIYSQQLPAESGSESDAVEYVTEALDRIEDIIDVMLVLTRGQDAVGERTPVDLAATARDAWADVDAPEGALDVELERTIQADGTHIRHLFQNLLENAVEHGSTSPRSQVHEDAVEHDADVTVTVGDLPTGFYVEDDGTGIPEDERDAIFDEGYTTASDNGGTGLGLAFVQKLTEVYEWDCTVTESESGGARFEFRNVT